MSLATATNESAASGKPQRQHLDFLDGLRGLAALYVVLGHLAFEEPLGLPTFVHRCLVILEQGHFAVDVFIVVSGFCLMLPVLQSQDNQLRGGIKGFFWRRSRRILPPYYAALIISLLVIGVFFRTVHSDDPRNFAAHAFTPGVLLSHLFLVHNLSQYWVAKIDSPMWSVATEWQIYVLFAFLLLPIWRRTGNIAVIGLAFSLGMLPHLLHPHGYNLDWAYPWFAGLFAFGMVGAVISSGKEKWAQVVKERMPWGLLSL